MRKLILPFVFLFLIIQLSAQNKLIITEGEPVFIYSLPKTEFSFDIEVEKVIQKPGQFYQYSQRYLATSDVITEEKVTYRLKNITLHTNPVPDASRTFRLQATNPLNFLTLNKQGILCGVNIQLPEKKIIEKKIIKELGSAESNSGLLPLGEEFMMAGSTAKLAEGAAKQIYRIRESRMMLLAGDMEQQPSDGKALSTMLQGLNNTEKELTSLFVGKTITETEIHSLKIVPDSAIENKVLFRLSALRGMVSPSDLGGVPFYISFIPAAIKTEAPQPKQKIEPAAFNTIIPAETIVRITDGVKTVFEKVTDVPQFGIILPVSEKVFNIRNVKIQVDFETGRIISITK